MMALQETSWAWQELSLWATEVNKLFLTKTLIFTFCHLHVMKWCVFRRQCLQHPRVFVVAGHVSLQPPDMFCQTYQRHDDKNWKAHWCQWQNLLALFTRVEACKCGHHAVLTAETVACCCGFNMRTCHYAFMVVIFLSFTLPCSLSQTCMGWSRWWSLCLERSPLCFLDLLHKLPTKLSKLLDHQIVS